MDVQNWNLLSIDRLNNKKHLVHLIFLCTYWGKWIHKHATVPFMKKLWRLVEDVELGQERNQYSCGEELGNKTQKSDLNLSLINGPWNQNGMIYES